MIMNLWQYIQQNPDVAISFMREFGSTVVVFAVLWIIAQFIPIIRDAVTAWRESQTQNASAEKRGDEIMLKFVEVSSQSQARMTDVVEAMGGKITKIETVTSRTNETASDISKQQQAQFKYIKQGLQAIYRTMRASGKTNDAANKQIVEHLEKTLRKLDQIIPPQSDSKEIEYKKSA